ncbi:MAG TPA: ATP-binding cassette domain-containing protein [Gemmatimonadaceae bacterium]|nr:ATP-binding cassette domain-containing protein [Gemmatimonadaceae bacterium]
MNAPNGHALSVRGLRAVRGTVEVLRGVDVDVARGETCALMGLSGAGKTTILRSVAALQSFSAGTIGVGGFELHPGPVPPESRLREFRRKLGLVFQSHALFEHLTVLDNVTLAPMHVLGWPRSRADEAAMKLLGSLGIAERARAYPREISGGQAQRAAIARALAMDPLVLLMDEPTSALDPARRGALGETLRALAAEGRGLLISTHDLDFVRGFADRVVILADGLVMETGTPKEILDNPRHPATRALISNS